MMPIRSESRNTQPMATVKPGISSPMVMKVNSAVLPGISVRSASHAAGTPKNPATSTAIVAKSSVSIRTFKLQGSVRTET